VKHWRPHELELLRQMRARFLDGTAGAHDYWTSPETLALYDATFGERIGWKWDAVLRELAARGWQPRSRRVLDCGCGSGSAGRRALAAWPHLAAYCAHDRSPLAVQFAAERVRAAFPAVAVSSRAEADRDTLLLLSHVLTELAPADFDRVLALAREAGEVVWVEAGTHAGSRRLIEARERLRAELAVIAPCTHRAPCGLLTAENARHWCHHFARVPSEIFQDARWIEFGRELGIDLRSLPYSFLVLARDAAPQPDGISRVIGQPREYKGHAKVLSCQASGVAEFMLQKRDAPALHRAVIRSEEAPLFRCQIAAGKIVGGEKHLPHSSSVPQPPPP
jgi:ribosomal protein RSM22 (predicted rRNA methylase)